MPAHRVRLIGREQDLVVARQALLSTEGRLLTLTGTGGCGKTRLALELAAHVLPEFPDGVWLVELAAIADAALVPQAMVSALNVRERPGESLLTTLVRGLSTREVLLVLDNCEHVIEVCAQVIEDLLDCCPQLRVLATSREALRIPGELAWRVPSLAVPDQHAGTEELLHVPAVQLFVERVQATIPSFGVTTRAAAIGGICRRLDGLPLAIELAAARVQALGVDQILARLDDSMHLLVGGSRTAPTRQQTLRATLAWSYDLLGEAERAVFRRLAVFTEGCSLDAAVSVCADSAAPARDVVDLLGRLVDKSLVVVDEPEGDARYRLLEPVRQYAEERLVASGERDIARRCHAEYYLAFAEARAHDTNIGGPRRFTATRELAREYPNIRGALAWSVEAGETQLGLRLAGSLLFFWQVYGPVSEGLAWIEQLLAMPGADERTAARAWALLAAAYLAQLHGDFAVAAAFCHEGALLAQRAAEPSLEWIALLFLANQGFRTGDLEAAEHFATTALVCARAAGLLLCEGQSLAVLAWTACENADYATAQPLAEQALRKARVGQDAWNEACALHPVGHAALGQGALQQARTALEAGLSVAQHLGEPRALTGAILDLLGEIELESSHPDQARVYLFRSLEMRHDSGERFGVVHTLDRLAALAAVTAQPERALRLVGAADALNTELGAPRTAAEQQKLERWLQSARDSLPTERADAVRAQGRALQLDDAVEFALGGAQTNIPISAPVAKPVRSALTQREQEVAVLLAQGMSNPQIAARLVISVHTAQRHVENILGKLGLSSRTQVAMWAVAHGLAAGPTADTPTSA